MPPIRKTGEESKTYRKNFIIAGRISMIINFPMATKIDPITIMANITAKSSMTLVAS